MLILRCFFSLVLIALLSAWSVASAQEYPSKSIRLFTQPVGGGNDFAARLIAQSIATNLKQQVIVENRAGVLAPELVANAPPDGYTLLLDGAPFWTTPLLQKVQYDPVRSFSPVTVVGITPNILVVHPSLPVTSVKGLIALAKARPGALSYGSAGVGSSGHLAGELLKSMAGVSFTHIPYKGAGPAIIDLIGGQVQIMFATASTAAPHIKSNRFRALAVTSAEPSPLAAGLATVASSGLPGYEAVNIIGIYATAGTPAAVIDRLNQEIVRVLRQPEVKEKFFGSGVDVIGSTSPQLGAMVKSETTRLAKLIKEAGIKVD